MSKAAKTTPFFKMHGIGNDFLVFDRVSQQVEFDEQQVRAWGDRRTGIGFDQLLLIDPPSEPDADFWFRIYNTDGSIAQQCGNGTRAVALLANHLGLSKKNSLTWQSEAGRIHTVLNNTDQVETTMTVPVLTPKDIPFDVQHATPAEIDGQYSIEDGDEQFVITPVSMGNPHGVIFVEDIFNYPVVEIGARLTDHPAFPERANIGFCQIVDRQFMRLRVFERGAGETRACGSGACAAVAAAKRADLVDSKVKVSLPGGKLRIKWLAEDQAVTMSGGATIVFQGELEISH